MTVRGQSWESW